jgi:hypothetical protein
MDARGEVLRADWRPKLGMGVPMSCIIISCLWIIVPLENSMFLYNGLALFVCDTSVYFLCSNFPFRSTFSIRIALFVG